MQAIMWMVNGEIVQGLDYKVFALGIDFIA